MEWNAAWVWHPPTPNPDNFYLYARREFDLDSVPQRVDLHITACALYKLYINGDYVGRGPNPSDPSRYYYDTYEIASLLQEGANVVAVTAYCYGPEPHGILKQNWGRGGLLAEARSAEGDVVLKTDAGWRVLQSPAWRQDMPINCTLYGDFKEEFDSRREPGGWREVGFDDSQWLEPEVLGVPPVEPWTRLVPREIPFLGGEAVRAVNVFWESASVTYAWREDYEVYNERGLAAAGGPRSKAHEPVRVKKTHDDFAPSLILDFGRDVTGYVEISVADSAGGVIEAFYGEDLYLVRVDRFILKGGPQVLRPFNRRTFRYLKLRFPDTPDEVRLDDVVLHMDTYPVEHRGAFQCSDDLLNRIWDVGRYTMRMSMLGHFVDCPWRERTLYGGDMWAENLIAQYAFGDPRMNAKCLRQMAHIQHDGPLPPYGPYRGADGFYPSWSAFWGLALLDQYLLAGDRATLDELWPNLCTLLEWALDEIDNDAGLIGRPQKMGKKADHPEGWDPFQAWMQAERTQYRPWDNIPFKVLLERSADVARLTGRTAEAAAYEEGARRMTEGILKRFIDAETGLCVARGGSRAGQYNTGVALWAEMQERDMGRGVAERMFGPDVDLVGAPFGALFVIDGLLRYGEGTRAVDFIRQYWGGMLERGATTYWDNFSLGWGPGVFPARGTSLCHGWAAGPTYCLPAYVLGVRPLEPGFRCALIEPQPADLDWAAGAVPTPHGPICVRWSRSRRLFTMQVGIPSGCRARVALPAETNHAHIVRVNGARVEPQRSGGRLLIEVADGQHQVELVRLG